MVTTEKIDRILAEAKELSLPLYEEYKNADEKHKQRLKFKMFEFLEATIKKVEEAQDDEYWEKWRNSPENPAYHFADVRDIKFGDKNEFKDNFNNL